MIQGTCPIPGTRVGLQPSCLEANFPDPDSPSSYRLLPLPVPCLATNGSCINTWMNKNDLKKKEWMKLFEWWAHVAVILGHCVTLNCLGWDLSCQVGSILSSFMDKLAWPSPLAVQLSPCYPNTMPVNSNPKMYQEWSPCLALKEFEV